jgi:hypothetical protein
MEDDFRSYPTCTLCNSYKHTTESHEANLAPQVSIKRCTRLRIWWWSMDISDPWWWRVRFWRAYVKGRIVCFFQGHLPLKSYAGRDENGTYHEVLGYYCQRCPYREERFK